MSNIIQELEQQHMQKVKIPDFAPGDTVSVQVKVIEGNRERLQAFEGVVIAKRNRGINSSFTVRKISHGEGVERVFQTFSPLIGSIIVKRRGDVRRAKLYYLRERSGRTARIREKLSGKASLINEMTDMSSEESLAAENSMMENPEIENSEIKKSTTKTKGKKSSGKDSSSKSQE